MTINLHLPESVILKPCITVFGVGGAGGNAVNNMIASNLEGVKFVVANTDAQALEYSSAERKIQLGEAITRGLGAGASPDVGKASAEEAMEDLLEHLRGSNMVFITAGMGGGTGTGAAPVIAKVAREQGILTVGVVTKPFHFEGSHRMRIAEYGLQEMQKHVDTLIIIPNQNLFRIANEKTTFADAFKMADDVLHAGVRGVTDLMIMPGLINLDFADVRTVMSEMGKAMMGTGESTGEKRALHAAEAAISNPLLDNVSMKGARGVLINITGGMDMTLFEVDEAANRIRDEVDPDANIIFGSTFNPELEGSIRVSVVATGIDAATPTLRNDIPASPQARPVEITSAEKQAPVAAPEPALSFPSVSAAFTAAEHSIHTLFTPKVEAPLPPEPEEEIFIAPPPAEPRQQYTSRNTYTVQRDNPAPHETAPSGMLRSEPRIAPKAPEKEPTRSGFSLFGKMLGGAMKRHVAEPEQPPAPKYKTEDEMSSHSTSSHAPKEDMLDIPAYIRRKNPTDL